jgi:phosphatidate phosphatase
MIWYLQSRLPKIQSLFIVPFLQVILTLIVCLCSVSRITDHRHHWVDVIGGFILGAVFAIYTCHVLTNNFNRLDKLKPIVCNGNASTNDSRRSVRRLLSTISSKEEFTLNNLE